MNWLEIAGEDGKVTLDAGAVVTKEDGQEGAEGGQATQTVEDGTAGTTGQETVVDTSGGQDGESGDRAQGDDGGEIIISGEGAAATTEEPEAPQPAQVDISTLTGGRFSTEEELRSALEKLNEEQVDPVKEYSHKVAKDLDEYISNGGDPASFAKFLALDVDNISDPKDAILTHERWENPELTPDELEAYVKDKYHLYDEDDDEYDERKAVIGRVALKKDARIAKENLKGIQEKFKRPNEGNANVPVSKEEQERVTRERITKWTPYAENIKKEFATIEIPIANGKGKFKFDVKSQDEISQLVTSVISRNNIEPNEENVDYVKNVVRTAYITTKLPDIISAAMSKARTLNDETWMKLRNNPSPIIDRAQNRGSTQQKPDMDEQIMKGFLGQ